MLYGLTGYAGSGKSEAAQHLETKGFSRLNFKDALVAEMKERFRGTIQSIYDETGNVDLGWPHAADWLFEQKPPIFRALMQNYGTDVRRKDDPLYWVKQWENAYCAIHPADVVVDDVRFLNEANAIHRYGGKVIRIVRSDVQNGGSHVSETEMDQIVPDYTIEVEYGDLEGLRAKLDELV